MDRITTIALAITSAITVFYAVCSALAAALPAGSRLQSFFAHVAIASKGREVKAEPKKEGEK
jgi:hypothetical protein